MSLTLVTGEMVRHSVLTETEDAGGGAGAAGSNVHLEAGGM